MPSNVELHDLPSHYVPGPVPYALITPPAYEDSPALPLCLMLLGGGGSRQNLADCQPLFDAWWSDGSIPPMILATPSPGMDYYLEDPGGTRWDSFLTEEFLPHVRATCNVGAGRSSTAITGISIGGYGALKTAFARPGEFGAVAAMQPMIEPGLRESDVRARNKIHHLTGGPPQLVGPSRSAALFEENNPANRAQANAAAIREAGLAIYLDAADNDFLNAHDGAEFLHRVLWDLDLSHEYHLIRGADHGGPSMRPRMRAMFDWTGAVLTALRSTPTPTAEERAVTAWIEGGMAGAPPPAPPSSNEFLRILRAQLQPARDRAAASDPTTNRRYGILPHPAPDSST